MAYMTAILLPDSKTSIALSQIGQVIAYDNGAGVLNLRGKMIGWVPCPDEETAAKVVAMIDQIINNPGRAKKPDWSMLKDIKAEA
jgi:hypothetical protein